MKFHGVVADAKPRADRMIRQSKRDQLQDLSFTSRQWLLDDISRWSSLTGPDARGAVQWRHRQAGGHGRYYCAEHFSPRRLGDDPPGAPARRQSRHERGGIAPDD